MSLNGNNKPITLRRTDPVDNVSVVLPTDVCIPGSSETEVGAVIQGPITPDTMMVERLLLPQKPSILVATTVVDTTEN